MTQNCAPSYSYRPTFTPSNISCEAPGFPEHRSRVTIDSNIFFRSKTLGLDRNQIAIECVSTPLPEFRVYFNNNVVETYPAMIGFGGIADLRTKISNNLLSIIEMPPLNYDVHDLRSIEDDGPMTGGLNPFVVTFLSGGNGGPTDASGLASIRTGPERTIFIITTTEDSFGNDINPPPSRKIQQWNGFLWISYCNNVPGLCPGEGTC